MKAFKSKEQKEELLKQLKHHQDLDTFVQGEWLTNEKVEGNGFKGCFYGCTMQTIESPREAFSKKYKIDLWYCYMTEKIFEGLPKGEYEKYPYESIEIIPVGFDFNKTKSAFHRGILLKQLDWIKDENVINDINKCADLFLVPYSEINEEEARSVVRSARTTRTTRTTRSERSSRSAAWAAARSVTESTKPAAWAAAESLAWSAWSAKSAAESNYYVWMKNFLFECINNEIK